MWQVPRNNEHSFSSRLSHLEEPTPLDRADISGDLTGFSSTNGALRAVKGTEEGNEFYDDLTRHCGKSLVTMNTVLQCAQLTWKNPHRWIEVAFQAT